MAKCPRWKALLIRRRRLEAVFAYEDLHGLPAGPQRFLARSQAVEFVVGMEDERGKRPWRLR